MTKLEEVARAINATYERFADPTPAQMARAAVEALKNAQADISDIHIDVHDQTYLYDFQIDRAFNAMIDAILNEEQK